MKQILIILHTTKDIKLLYSDIKNLFPNTKIVFIQESNINSNINVLDFNMVLINYDIGNMITQRLYNLILEFKSIIPINMIYYRRFDTLYQIYRIGDVKETIIDNMLIGADITIGTNITRKVTKYFNTMKILLITRNKLKDYTIISFIKDIIKSADIHIMEESMLSEINDEYQFVFYYNDVDNYTSSRMIKLIQERLSDKLPVYVISSDNLNNIYQMYSLGHYKQLNLSDEVYGGKIIKGRNLTQKIYKEMNNE